LGSLEGKAPFKIQILIRSTADSWQKTISLKKQKQKLHIQKITFFFAVQAVDELGLSCLGCFPQN
jgi:hypothetical protein